MPREMLCISCPLGCRLEVSGSVEDFRVTGNKCKRGEIYAREEISSPKRIVTATVALKNARNLNRLPVRTDGALAKQKIASLLNELYKMEIGPPIAMGDVIIPNYGDTGVSVIASRSCREEG